jgi:hypothetical protein
VALGLGSPPNLAARPYRVAPFVSAGCTATPAAAPSATAPDRRPQSEDDEFGGLAALARAYGFTVF